MSDMKKGLEKYSAVLMLLGTIGLIYTGLSLIRIYNGNTRIQDMILPLIYNFIPFLISFLLLRVGMNMLIKRSK